MYLYPKRFRKILDKLIYIWLLKSISMPKVQDVFSLTQVPADPPDACPRKHLQYEPCREDRISNSDVCRHLPRETKNRGIAWNCGSALYNVFLFFWWLCGAVLWWVVGFGFGKLEKVLEIITSVVEVVIRVSFILPRFFFPQPHPA